LHRGGREVDRLPADRDDGRCLRPDESGHQHRDAQGYRGGQNAGEGPGYQATAPAIGLAAVLGGQPFRGTLRLYRVPVGILAAVPVALRRGRGPLEYGLPGILVTLPVGRPGGPEVVLRTARAAGPALGRVLAPRTTLARGPTLSRILAPRAALAPRTARAAGPALGRILVLTRILAAGLALVRILVLAEALAARRGLVGSAVAGIGLIAQRAPPGILRGILVVRRVLVSHD